MKKSDAAVRYLTIPDDIDLGDEPELKAPSGTKFAFADFFGLCVKFIPCTNEAEAAVFEALVSKCRRAKEREVKVLEADEFATLSVAVQRLRAGNGPGQAGLGAGAQMAFMPFFVAVARAPRTDPRPAAVEPEQAAAE